MTWTPKTGTGRRRRAGASDKGAPVTPLRPNNLIREEREPNVVPPEEYQTQDAKRVRARRARTPAEKYPNLDRVTAESPRKVAPSVPTAEIRARLARTDSTTGNRWKQITRDVKAGEYTWAEFAEGLDEEELARGQLRAIDGTFTGAPPQLVPREFFLACQREQKRRFEELFSGEVLGITREYLRMSQDGTIKPETRAKMMQYAMERIFGPIPKDIRIAQSQPWEAMVVNVVAEEGQTDMPEHLKRRYAGYAERQDDPSALGE